MSEKILEKRSVLDRSLSAGKWSLLNIIFQRVLTFGSFFILARILLPEDFGLAAILLIVPNFLDGITAFPFDTVIVQDQEENQKYLDSVWTLNLIRSAIIFGVIFFGAPFIAKFFNISYATTALRFAGASVFLQGFVNIGQLYFFKDMDFRKLFIRDMILKVSCPIFAISLAFFFRSYFALFLGNILSVATVTIGTYILHPYRPKFDFKFNKLKKLMPQGLWFFGQNIINEGRQTIEDSLVGKFTGPINFGLFGKGKALSSAPTLPIIKMINNVSFPAYAKIQNTPALIREGIHKTFDLMLSLAIPYLLLILLTGNRIVLIALGPNWAGITPLLKTLTVASTLSILTSALTSSIFNAIGKPKIQFFIYSMNAVLNTLAIIILVPIFGIMGGVFAILLSTIITTLYTLYHVIKSLSMDFYRIFETMIVVAIGCAIPIPIALYLLKFAFTNSTIGYISLSALSGLEYGAIIFLIGKYFKKGPYKTINLIIHSFLKTSVGLTFFPFLIPYFEPISISEE